MCILSFPSLFGCWHESGAKQICGMHCLYHLVPAYCWSLLGYGAPCSMRSSKHWFAFYVTFLRNFLSGMFFFVPNIPIYSLIRSRFEFPCLNKSTLPFTWKLVLPLCFLIAPLLYTIPYASKIFEIGVVSCLISVFASMWAGTMSEYIYPVFLVADTVFSRCLWMDEWGINELKKQH